MSLYETNDLHPYRNLLTPTGVEIEFWTNDCLAETEHVLKEFPEFKSSFSNDRWLRATLIEAGVVYAPEIPAYSPTDGSELAFDQAYYVDKRIGTEAVWGIAFWINGVAKLPEGRKAVDRQLSPSEMRVLVALAMDELGISEKLAQIQLHDTETQAATPDLNEILKRAQEYEALQDSADGPQHLAPEDLI